MFPTLDALTIVVIVCGLAQHPLGAAAISAASIHDAPVANAHPSAAAADPGASFVSVCGDPGMRQVGPRVLLEGWNFCNRCGRACTVAPRWADCIGEDGRQAVTPTENAAGLPVSLQNQSACDAFTEAKERSLGQLCARTGVAVAEAGGNATSYFWTAMLKSGAMNASEHGRLCGLWCAHKEPSCNAQDLLAAPILQALGPQLRDRQQAASLYSGSHTGGSGQIPPPPPAGWPDDDYYMRQPRVKHQWSAPDGSGGFSGSFYGTFDGAVNLSTLPLPATVIKQALTPAPRSACNISGIWLGNNGDRRYPIDIQQSVTSDRINGTCEWAPTKGVPAPWQRSGAFPAGGDTLTLGPDTGQVRGSSTRPGDSACGDIICWTGAVWWCRPPGCSPGAKQVCDAPSPSPPPGPHPSPSKMSSYFGLEWFVRDGRRIFRNVIRTGTDLGWLMLYTGPEAATGEKGGYPWDGRGIMTTVPVSTSINASQWPASAGKRPDNNFQVRVWSNITLWPGGPGFYFLNMAACWKDDGRQCDYDITTDVTRYLLFQLPSPHASPQDSNRCGPASGQRRFCPPRHTYRNGTVVELGDQRFPYRAYHSVSTRAARPGFHCKHDCWSNPQDQDWVRIEPSPEWAEYV